VHPCICKKSTLAKTEPAGAKRVTLCSFTATHHKAPGADGLLIELLKCSGPSGLQILLSLFNLVHDRECIPQGWWEGTLVSMPKSGDLTNCTHFRGLTLLPALSKLFSNLLLQRLSPHVELIDHQYGFRHGRGIADALFALDDTVHPRVQRRIGGTWASATLNRRRSNCEVVWGAFAQSFLKAFGVGASAGSAISKTVHVQSADRKVSCALQGGRGLMCGRCLLNIARAAGRQLSPGQDMPVWCNTM
jgi:hypothetical protein